MMGGHPRLGAYAHRLGIIEPNSVLGMTIAAVDEVTGDRAGDRVGRAHRYRQEIPGAATVLDQASNSFENGQSSRARGTTNFMHVEERERLILDAIAERGFITYRTLQSKLRASPATIRRDLTRLADEGRIERVRGGAKLPGEGVSSVRELSGTPFEQAVDQQIEQKRAIGRVAAGLCSAGEGIMIDGGTTTYQMCPHLAGLELQVLTNSLHIVSALLVQPGTRILVPSGAVFREQNIILAPADEESMPRFHAPKLFMGAAAVGPQGIMQADVILVAAERRLVDRAEEVIICADSSKFARSSGNVVCGLDEVDIFITDHGISDRDAAMIEAAGVKLIVA